MSNELHEVLQRFDALPDDAILPSRVTGIILGVSERTVRYHPQLPRIQISRGRYGQRVGDIRKLARKGMADAHVVLTDENGRPTGVRRHLNPGDDPKLIAVAMMKAQRNSGSPRGFNDKIIYPRVRF